MSSKTTALLVSAAVLAVASRTDAFVPASSFAVVQKQQTTNTFAPLFAEETETETDAVFNPADDGEKEEEIGLDKVEMLGRGAAKVCFGVFSHMTAQIDNDDRDFSSNRGFIARFCDWDFLGKL